MRVIAGAAKGRRLKAPKGQGLRPTSARVKEALFNILARDLSGARVLDLFAGTGNLSVEALSRGAAKAVLVDVSRGAAAAIRANLAKLALANRCEVWTAPVLKAVRALARRGEKFDLIFLDPPYEKGWIAKVLRALEKADLLAARGVVVAEHSVREKVEESCGRLRLRDQRRYGTTLLSFFEYGAV